MNAEATSLPAVCLLASALCAGAFNGVGSNLLAAEGEAEKARQAEAAAAAEEAERIRVEEAARRERERVERNMKAWQQFVQDIENMHGEDGMEKTIGAFLTSGGVEIAGAATEGVSQFLAEAGKVSSLATATSGLLQGGWSFLVAQTGQGRGADLGGEALRRAGFSPAGPSPRARGRR